MKSVKLKLMAAAVAATVASPAFAAIDNYLTHNGELFLTVYNPNAATPVSFYFDLTPIAGQAALGTFNLNDFLPTGVPGGGVGAGSLPPSPNPVGAVEQAGTNFTWNINTSTAGWSEFLAAAGASSGWKWQVVAGDSVGSQGISHQIRYLSTSVDPLSVVQGQTTGNLLAYRDTQANIDTINSTPSATPADGSGTFLEGAGGEAYFGTGFGERWKGRASYDTLGNVGQSLAFFYLTGRAATTAQIQQFANGANWTFAQNGAGGYDLIYSAVPEPGEWALMLAGLSVLGMVTRRRRAKNEKE